MKSFEELYNEVLASDELKAEAAKAGKEGKQQEFLKAHGCDATQEEVAEFLKAKAQGDLPLTDDELKMMNGGGWFEIINGFTIGAASGASLGFISGPIGAGIGGVLGGIVGAVGGALSSDDK